MKRDIIILASVIAAAMILCTSIASIYANGNGGAPSGAQNGRPQDGKHLPWMRSLMTSLTREQRMEINRLVQEMMQAGSSPLEIEEAVDAKLAEWGIEAPEDPGPPSPPWMMNLTEEQRMEIRQLIETMRRNGASRDEITEVVLKRLEEYGIDVTHLKINRDDDHFMGRHRGRILDQLTEEQKTELLQKIKELRESGATRNEIRDMVHEQLKEWGIETPECQEP